MFKYKINKQTHHIYIICWWGFVCEILCVKNGKATYVYNITLRLLVPTSSNCLRVGITLALLITACNDTQGKYTIYTCITCINCVGGALLMSTKCT